MGWKNLVSRDERKAKVVAALKRKSGGTKVTMLVEDAKAGLFRGNVLRPSPTRARCFVDVGQFTVTQAEVDATT